MKSTGKAPVLFFISTDIINMKISVIQPDIKWEDKFRNFRNYEHHISSLDNPGIIILPEMFSTGFTPESESQCEPPGKATFDWMVSIAAKKNAGLCGSYIVKSGRKYFNRWIFVTPEAESWHYDKRHLFNMNGVEKSFTAGKKRVVFRFRDFRICPGVCYDLRFPVWCRNRNDYDLMINSANWPMARRDVWITLLKARAIENLCYIAGSNRIGTDGLGVKYSGDSMIIGPKGEEIANAGRNKESAITADISIEELREFRKKFPAHLDSDNFTIDF